MCECTISNYYSENIFSPISNFGIRIYNCKLFVSFFSDVSKLQSIAKLLDSFSNYHLQPSNRLLCQPRSLRPCAASPRTSAIVIKDAPARHCARAARACDPHAARVRARYARAVAQLFQRAAGHAERRRTHAGVHKGYRDRHRCAVQYVLLRTARANPPLCNTQLTAPMDAHRCSDTQNSRSALPH